jgi:hypothetical protein
VYTLDINVLPQVVGIQAESLLPGGGPATSLIITFQGDRLDPATAQNPANYTVRFLGEDGQAGTGDDEIIPISSGEGAVVYNPGANVGVSSGRTFATAVRQTVTLLFDDALPEGLYQISVSAGVRTADFNANEANLLAPAPGFNGHALVSRQGGGQVVEGSVTEMDIHNPAGWQNAGFDSYAQGTAFLTQLANDAGALLDGYLGENGDDPGITGKLNSHMLARCLPGVGTFNWLIVWLDPVSISLADPGGARAALSLQTGAVSSTLPRTFVEVGGNVQVMVMAAVSGTMTLSIGDVQPTARGGAVLITPGQTQTVALTDGMRSGERSFSFDMGSSTTTTSTVTSVGSVATSLVSALLPVLVPPDVTAASIAALGEALSTTVVETVAVLATLGTTGLTADLGAAPTDPDSRDLGLTSEFAVVQMMREVGAVVGNLSLEHLDLAPLRTAASVSLGQMGNVVTAAMESLGVRDFSWPDLGLGDLGQALRDAGGSIAGQIWEHLRGLRNGTPAPVPPGGGGEQRDQPPEEMPDEQVLGGFWEDTRTDSVADSDGGSNLSGMVVAALFASGAYFGCTAAGEREERKSKQPALKPRKRPSKVAR